MEYISTVLYVAGGIAVAVVVWFVVMRGTHVAQAHVAPAIAARGVLMAYHAELDNVAQLRSIAKAAADDAEAAAASLERTRALIAAPLGAEAVPRPVTALDLPPPTPLPPRA